MTAVGRRVGRRRSHLGERGRAPRRGLHRARGLPSRAQPRPLASGARRPEVRRRLCRPVVTAAAARSGVQNPQASRRSRAQRAAVAYPLRA